MSSDNRLFTIGAVIVAVTLASVTGAAAFYRNLGALSLLKGVMREPSVETARHLDRAEAFLVRARRLDGGAPETQRLRARVARLAGEPARAVDLLERTPPGQSPEILAALELGLAYQQMGNRAEAAAIWRSVQAGPYFLGQATLCRARGQRECAIEYAAIASAIDPESAAAYFALGDAHGLVSAASAAAAAQAYRRALELDPSPGIYRDYMEAQVAYIDGRYADAFSCLSRAHGKIVAADQSGAQAPYRSDVYRLTAWTLLAVRVQRIDDLRATLPFEATPEIYGSLALFFEETRRSEQATYWRRLERDARERAGDDVRR